MTVSDLLKCRYTANVCPKDLKDGMLVIEAEDWDDPNSLTHVSELKGVVVTKEKITFEATAIDPFKNRVLHFMHEIIDPYDEPVMTVYFPTIKKGLQFGVKRNDIRRV